MAKTKPTNKQWIKSDFFLGGGLGLEIWRMDWCVAA